MDHTFKRYAKQVFACGACQNWRKHWDTLVSDVGKYNDIQLKILRKTKDEIEALPFFAGFDGDIETIRKIRRLNNMMLKSNNKAGGVSDG
jgi:hypothetical protein